MGKKVIVVGATGLIGENLLGKLLNDDFYQEVLVISRRPLTVKHRKLIQIVDDFENLSRHALQIQGDVVFCCLGSTIKKTPDLQVYRKIDYQYPLDIAHIAFEKGAVQYHLVSAMGADLNSSLFYSRTKGEVERDLAKIGFPSLHIYRPALLDGNRKEERVLENVMIYLMRGINLFLLGPLRKYRSIRIERVADAMIKKAMTDELGTYIYNSAEIDQIAKGLESGSKST